MATNNDKVNPNTYLEHLAQDDYSANLDTVHQEVILDLFQIPNADTLNDIARANMMKTITMISTSAVLIQPPVNRAMLLLHQIFTEW